MRQDNAIDTNVTVHENALPVPLFRDLLDAVKMIGRDAAEKNISYSTTFWFERGAEPTNLAEVAIQSLHSMVDPGETCVGVEWWLGRLRNGKGLGFHFDRDLALHRKTGETICPLLGSVFYLNDYPSAPTVIIGQIPGQDGKSKFPEEPTCSKAIDAVANRYMVFPGNLRHGVTSDEGKLHLDPRGRDDEPERRLTLLVNYWHRRPLAPICNDYDGSIYPSLRRAFEEKAMPPIAVPA
ncbi:hypothetical protein [Zhengella mangrovi]|uniref:hypothetical protein n=1 Tax=Zhengella mangrovi TaxID=1982044 RepID=UPI0010553D5A|nr:hypothetical protein [Zhengella mangrovi]